MLSRKVLLVAVLLVAVVAIGGAFVSQWIRCHGGCTRNIATPYRMLLDRMRVLADAGQTKELHALIITAQEHADDVSTVCWELQNEEYANEVYEWTH